MLLLLILPIWIVGLAVVTCLCAAARVGDNHTIPFEESFLVERAAPLSVVAPEPSVAAAVYSELAA